MGSVFKPKPTPPAPPPPPPVPAPAPAPTQAEVSQSAETDMTQRKVKRRGRSATILTGPAGVEETTTLGKQSLLGQ